MILYALLVGIGLPLMAAIEMPININVPAQVTVETPFEAILNASVQEGDTGYSTAFQVFLASSYEDVAPYTYLPECMNVNARYKSMH
jgi:hypothetical protein